MAGGGVDSSTDVHLTALQLCVDFAPRINKVNKRGSMSERARHDRCSGKQIASGVSDATVEPPNLKTPR